MAESDQSKLILVVEDDAVIRGSIVEILQMEGFRAHGCANGKLALEYLHRAPLPQLILLDLMMPVMDGWQFRSEQQTDERLKRLPVVIVTADDGAQTKVAQAHAQGWVKKPIDIDTLITEVKRCML